MTEQLQLRSGDAIEYSSHCPVHGGKRAKVYGFGRFWNAPNPNASVTTYQGYKCTVCTVGTSLKKTYHDSWAGGESEARFHCQRLDPYG